MPNPNAPYGLRPVGYLNGSPFTGKGRTYYIPSTDNNAFAIGDPLVLAGSADAFGVASVTLATAGSTNLVLGSLMGMGNTKYGGSSGDPASPQTIVIPATKTKDYYVMVADDPNIIFSIREGASGTALAAADVGLNASLVSGSNNGYVSGWRVDNSTEAATAALQLKLLGLRQVHGNEFGANAEWLVLINQHCYKDVVAGL